MTAKLHVAPAPEPMATPARGAIYAVASGKGGVGKTWLSITLAHALAAAGQRILLFDADLGLANVDVQLGLTPRIDLSSVFGGRATLEAACVSHPACGFDVLAGLSGSGGLSTLPPTRLAEVGRDLLRLAASYDVTILDLGAGVGRTVRRLATLAHCCLVVTTDEPTALTDAYAFIKLTAQDAPRRGFRTVINMAHSTTEGERTHGVLLKACRNFLGLEPQLAGTIRRDRRVTEAIRHQAPLLLRHPTSDAAEDVRQIAGRLLTAR